MARRMSGATAIKGAPREAAGVRGGRASSKRSKASASSAALKGSTASTSSKSSNSKRVAARRTQAVSARSPSSGPSRRREHDERFPDGMTWSRQREGNQEREARSRWEDEGGRTSAAATRDRERDVRRQDADRDDFEWWREYGISRGYHERVWRRISAERDGHPRGAVPHDGRPDERDMYEHAGRDNGPWRPDRDAADRGSHGSHGPRRAGRWSRGPEDRHRHPEFDRSDPSSWRDSAGRRGAETARRGRGRPHDRGH